MDFTICVNQCYMTIMMLRDIQHKHNYAINISPAFYHTVIRCFMQSLFVDISKMFDNNNRNESITTLLNSIRDNLQLVDDHPVTINNFRTLDDISPTTMNFQSIEGLINHFLNEIKKNQSDIASVRKLRNKYYGHLDKSSQDGLKKLFKDNSVSLDIMGKLLILNTNICNALNVYFFDKTVIPLVINHDDLYYTISCLEKYKDFSEKYKDYI